VRRSAIRTCELDDGRPQVGPLITQRSGPTGSATRVTSLGAELIPGPLIHPDVSATSSLAPTDEHRPPVDLKVGFCEGERLGDPKARPPEQDDEPTQPLPVAMGTGLPHDGNDLFDPRRIGWVATPLFAGRRPLLRWIELSRAGSVRSSMVPPLVGYGGMLFVQSGYPHGISALESEHAVGRRSRVSPRVAPASGRGGA
jgi:hypothetical protein